MRQSHHHDSPLWICYRGLQPGDFQCVVQESPKGEMVDCSVHIVLCPSRAFEHLLQSSKPPIGFDREGRKLDIDGVAHFFFHVVVQDANSSRTVQLMNGLSNREYLGAIPGTFVAQRFAKFPWFSCCLEKNRAKWTKQFGHLCSVSDHFKSKNALLEWNIQILTPVHMSHSSFAGKCYHFARWV